ncbi:hypothetical protein HPB50_018565 [Hyalomma asiaticum]|uniref:Uncharacterized protein n=1 Tax=Hyalomma asiaticum TaxID=266040 RepID=A0ACB7SY03_HYAAI|nr:hypothetical protein HPB50_018565 [Hyalomma asiaticum]
MSTTPPTPARDIGTRPATQTPRHPVQRLLRGRNRKTKAGLVGGDYGDVAVQFLARWHPERALYHTRKKNVHLPSPVPPLRRRDGSSGSVAAHPATAVRHRGVREAPGNACLFRNFCRFAATCSFRRGGQNGVSRSRSAQRLRDPPSSRNPLPLPPPPPAANAASSDSRFA